MPSLLSLLGTGTPGSASRLRAARRRLVRPVTNRLVNPFVRPLVERGLLEPGWALLETRGRRSGRRRVVPVGNGLRDGVFWIVTEHGYHADYVRNILVDPRMRVRVGGRWRSGSDDYVVFARTADAGARGISAFLVDGSSEGISVRKLRTMGMPGWQLGSPRFEDVEVPAENLLGGEGDGFKIAMATFDRSRPTVAAQAVGVGQGAIELAGDYALRRHAFGKPLFDHQGIQFKLAGLKSRGGRPRGR